MTITASLAPIPKWVLINNAGTVAGGAKLYTYSSLNHVLDKLVYRDAGMSIPYTQPILFDLNGVQGPFYWTVNSSDPNDTYYLEAYDSNDNLLWTMNDFSPSTSGGGGGGNVTTYIPLVNYISNNQFIDHIDDTTSPIVGGNTVLAPDNHKGFTPSLITPVVGTYGVVGPDIQYLKDSISVTDQITFPLFALASSPLTGGVTPVDYLRYRCTNSPIDETYRCIQFPITQKVKNLSNNAMTFVIWAAVAVTPVTLTLYVRQYFGSGTAASAEVRTSVGTITLTTTWTPYTISLIVPDVAGKSIGTPGAQTDDDALYLQLEFPLGAPCDVSLTKPALYLGTLPGALLEFDDYDQINSINSTPRTGDVKTSLMSSPSKGWVAMNDGSIGNVGSGATTRANKDTFQLYKTIWDGVLDAWAPVSTGRGASAIADFIAGKTLTLPRSLGRALAGAGTGSGLTSRALGQYLGEETHTLTVSEMPSHNHPGSTVSLSNIAGRGTGAALFISNTGSTAVSVASQGGGGSHNNMQPSSFMNVFIKL